MRVGHIEIFVSDPLVARRFYEDVLGFEVTAVQGERLIWLKKNALVILLRPGRGGQRTPRYEDAVFGIVLYTDAMDRILGNLKAKGVEVDGPLESRHSYTFTDPDGNWFLLVDPEDL